MGRQINYYMSPKVQENFVEYLIQNQFVFLDYYAKTVEQPLSKSVYRMYLYKPEYGDVVMRKDCKDILDVPKSPVIQFNKTSINEEKKKVIWGRLWVEIKYYDEKGEIITKNDSLVKDYGRLNRWIKKNVPRYEYRSGKHVYKEYINDEILELQKEGFILA